MAKPDSEYKRFLLMQSCGLQEPFLHEIFSVPDSQGIKCALWPTLYLTTTLCNTMLMGHSNRDSKICFMHKLLSPVVDYSLDFDILQFRYDRWLFRTITGTINSSQVSGCSPNCGLQHKSFSATYWHCMAAPAPHRCHPPVRFSIFFSDSQPMQVDLSLAWLH